MGSDFLSIELASALAATLAVVRVFTLLRISTELPRLSREVVSQSNSGISPTLRRNVRKFGRLYPFARLASPLSRAVNGYSNAMGELSGPLAIAKRRAKLRTQRAQVLDLFAIALLFGVGLFAGEMLPTGFIFWGAVSALALSLFVDFFARNRLRTAAETSLAEVVSALQSLSE